LWIAIAIGCWTICGAPQTASAYDPAPPFAIALEEESLPAATASATPSPSSSGSPGATSPATQTPTPAAPSQTPSPTADSSSATYQPPTVPADVPPPTDFSSSPITAPVSDASLEPLIEKTGDPSLSASLRTTEEARNEIAGNHFDEAIRTLGHAISINSGNAYAYFYLGRAYLMKKDYHQALTFFSRAEMGLNSDPAWLGETISFEGACYEELGREQDAALAYQRALQSAPGNLMARAGYGRLAAALPQPTPVEEQPSADDSDQSPPEENDIRTVPDNEPLDTPPPDEAAPRASGSGQQSSPQ
jgi:hypothetical protein